MQKAQGVQTREQALQVIKSAGMDNTFLDHALNTLDSSKAQKLSFMANMLGVNLGDLKNGINDLKSPNGTNYSGSKNNMNTDELASLKRGLKRLK